MKLFTVFFMIAFNSIAQQESWSISGKKAYLPSFNCDAERYYSSNKPTRHFYYERRPNKHLKGKKLKDSSAFMALHFIQENMMDSTFLLSMNHVYADSLDLDFLRDHELIQDSMILINFPLYRSQYYKTFYDPCENCENKLPILFLRGHQIDGERLVIEITSDTMEILSLNIGFSEFSDVKKFKEWILIGELYRRFNLFRDLNLDAYFSKEIMTIEIQEYISALKK